MASAFKDKRGWIADFRGLYAPGKVRSRIRLPHATDHESALKISLECEHYCRLLEASDYPSPEDVRYAFHIRAITEPQKDALIDGHVPETEIRVKPLTITEAAERHPSTQRESEVSPREYIRHNKELKEFIAWSGLEFIRDVKLDLVQRWIKHLKAEGYSWHGRRHRLLSLRRACRMGTQEGIPDVLAGFVLDRQDVLPEVKVWSFDQLAQGLQTLEGEGSDPRTPAILSLGGFMGLRPSEIIRVNVGDIVGNVLEVGVRERKNSASRRNLPIPSTVKKYLTVLTADQPPEAPLIRSRFGRFRKESFSQKFAPMLKIATGAKLPIKCLRKSFATWTIRAGFNQTLIEAWLGHQSGTIMPITARHYLADIQVRELQPIADKIDEYLQEFLHASETHVVT